MPRSKSLSNMHISIYISGITAVFLSAILGAQTAPKPEPPVAPFTRALAERSQWLLQYAGSTEDAGKADTETGPNEIPTVLSIQFTKVGKVRHDVVRWSNGKKTEGWKLGAIYAAEQLLTDNVLLSHDKYSLSTFDLGSTDFSELAWIEAKHFTGIKEHRGELCHEFVDDELRYEIVPGVFSKVPLAPPANPGAEASVDPEEKKTQAADIILPGNPIKATKRSALISVKRRLPVVLVSDGRVGTYQWQAVPTVDLNPPERFISPIKMWEGKLSSSLKRPARP